MPLFIQIVDDLILLVVGDCLKLFRKNNDDISVVQNLELPECKANKRGELQSVDNDTKELSPRITATRLSSCQNYILICTSDKKLVVFENKKKEILDGWQLHSVRECPRKCVKVLITEQKPLRVVTADRAGDVYEFMLDKPETVPRLLMGRLSMLLDMALTSKNEYIIVSDRDEKIQVSKYPQCYEIVAFCLGHNQFITSLVLLEKYANRLASVSGDGKLKIWNIQSGECLSSYDCWEEAQRDNQLHPFLQFQLNEGDRTVLPPLKKVLCCGSLIVVLYSRVPYIHVLSYDGNSITTCGGIHTEKPVWDAELDRDSKLWVLDPTLSLYQLRYSGGHKLLKSLQDKKVFETIQDKLYEQATPDEELDTLYKQWFPNVDDYMERKKRRMEEKKNRVESKKLKEVEIKELEKSASQ